MAHLPSQPDSRHDEAPQEPSGLPLSEMLETLLAQAYLDLEDADLSSDSDDAWIVSGTCIITYRPLDDDRF